MPMLVGSYSAKTSLTITGSKILRRNTKSSHLWTSQIANGQVRLSTSHPDGSAPISEMAINHSSILWIATKNGITFRCWSNSATKVQQAFTLLLSAGTAAGTDCCKPILPPSNSSLRNWRIATLRNLRSATLKLIGTVQLFKSICIQPVLPSTWGQALTVNSYPGALCVLEVTSRRYAEAIYFSVT